MKKSYYRLIAGIVVLIAGSVYYNRPLPSHDLVDPGEDYFTLPERTLPSSWEIITKEFGHDSQNLEEAITINEIDKALTNRNPQNAPLSIEYQADNSISHINWEAVDMLFKDYNRNNIQKRIDTLEDLMSNHELYPPELDYSSILPQFS